MADIFHEVEEDLRAERYQRLWQRYSGVIVGAALLVVAGVGGYVFYKDRTVKQQQIEGARFAEALAAAEKGEADAALAGFTLLAQEAKDGFRFLSLLKQADIHLKKNDKSAALAIFDRIAADGGFEQFYRDYAVYRGALARMDGDDPATVKARVQPLLAAGNLWRPLALELAGLADLKAGKKEDARSLLQQAADDAMAPAGVRARAAELLSAIGG